MADESDKSVQAQQATGTPLDKAPEPDLGTGIIAKERYTDAGFMREEWEHIWTKVWLVGCLERDLDEPGAYCATEIGPESVHLTKLYTPSTPLSPSSYPTPRLAYVNPNA